MSGLLDQGGPFLILKEKKVYHLHNSVKSYFIELNEGAHSGIFYVPLPEEYALIA